MFSFNPKGSKQNDEKVEETILLNAEEHKILKNEKVVGTHETPVIKIVPSFTKNGNVTKGFDIVDKGKIFLI